MIGPVIRTTGAIPQPSCVVCSEPAVASVGVARAQWLCRLHLPAGLDAASDALKEVSARERGDVCDLCDGWGRIDDIECPRCYRRAS